MDRLLGGFQLDDGKDAAFAGFVSAGIHRPIDDLIVARRIGIRAAFHRHLHLAVHIIQGIHAIEVYDGVPDDTFLVPDAIDDGRRGVRTVGRGAADKQHPREKKEKHEPGSLSHRSKKLVPLEFIPGKGCG